MQALQQAFDFNEGLRIPSWGLLPSDTLALPILGRRASKQGLVSAESRLIARTGYLSGHGDSVGD